MEFLERLDVEHDEERWLVRAPGAEAPHVVRILAGEDVSATHDATRKWVGPIHPRICAILGMQWNGERLAVEVEDERGPRFVDAAAQLEDPVERERWAVSQVIAVADGIAAMQQRHKFVHRRIDADSMFVDVSGHAKLRAPIIFVEAGPRPGRMGAGVITRTPAYLSPEQVRGMTVTHATDVFSLASVLYLALTGTRPFTADTDFGLLQAILQDAPAPLATHAPELRRVIDRALVKEPAARIPDVGTFAGELWQAVPDAMEYDAVISDRIVAWRASAPHAKSERTFESPPCRMQWDQLHAVTDGVRHCTSCKQDVVRVNSLAQIVPLAGRCVSYTGGD